ncbi:hypothetical protein N7G274_002865 [Stereocaulon virgatum]|uniref:non-specific serine/threonine protein kinase n=1 Tax=Stereocaulon virgatum TaxID=373712 RepID=A0ABR4AG90_9LECA
MPEYRAIRKLGKGGQGVCWLVQRVGDGVRLVRKSTDDIMYDKDTPLEVRILRDVLDIHRRTLNLVDWTILTLPSPLTQVLITYYEYYAGGDLDKWMPKGTEEGKESSESFVWYVFEQMADVLAYLHYGYECNKIDRQKDWQLVLHCDIKPANIFLRTPRSKYNKYPELVLGDFGLATFKEGRPLNGTPGYWSPEAKVTGNTKYTDVWALGATIHEMVHGASPREQRPKHPPNDPKEREAWNKYAEEKRWPRRMPDSYSRNLNNLMMDCLQISAGPEGRRRTSLQLIRKIRAENPSGRSG